MKPYVWFLIVLGGIIAVVLVGLDVTATNEGRGLAHVLFDQPGSSFRAAFDTVPQGSAVTWRADTIAEIFAIIRVRRQDNDKRHDEDFVAGFRDEETARRLAGDTSLAAIATTRSGPERAIILSLVPKSDVHSRQQRGSLIIMGHPGMFVTVY